MRLAIAIISLGLLVTLIHASEVEGGDAGLEQFGK